MIRKKAFSLTELLFVMIIISALVAIAIPKYQEQQHIAIINTMQSDTEQAINLLIQEIQEIE